MIRAPGWLLLAVLALASAPSDAAPKPAPTIRDLKSRPVDVRVDAPVEASAARAMENYRRFLELQQTDPRMRAEALRRLADLNLEAGELERMEKEVTALDLAGAEAIRLYGVLLQAHPDYPRNDQVLYQLARAYETTGQPEQALVTLDRIVAGYPAGSQLDEVHFRRGEILFSAKRYRDAEKAYEAVVARGRSSRFYEESLYKHGWALFKQSLNEESLTSFAGVLDAMLVSAREPGPLVRIDRMPRAERELVEDTLRVMSITFSYLEGAHSLDEFAAGGARIPWAHLLYSRLGDLYVEKQRYQDAADTYRAFVKREPNSDFAPGLAMQAIEAYRKGGFAQLVLDGKREYIEHYGFAAPFWQGRERRDPAYQAVVAELKTNLKDVAQHFHASAQSSKKIEDYQQAARWYRDYLHSFPDDPESAGTNLLLAETLFESRQYGEAAEEYERTAYGYPRSGKSAAAAHAAVVAYEKEEARLEGAAREAWHRRSTEAALKFAESFPEHPESAVAHIRAAQEIFSTGDRTRAVQVSERILARQPPVDRPKQRIAWTIIGQSHFDAGAFPQAESAYIQARALLPPDDAMQVDLTERIAAAVYRQAEAKQKAGDGAGAVEDFLRVGRVAPGAKIRATAEYDAAAQLVKLEDWPRAIAVLEGYRRDFPQSEFAAEVTRNLAVAYAKAGRPAQAAVEFERIAASSTEDAAVRREAVLQAADLYEQASDTAKTIAMLEQFVAQYPQPAGEAIEARQRLADLAARAGRGEQLRHWRLEIVKADREAGPARSDRTRTLAAKSQLALAETPRDVFRGVRLTQPLKKSLSSKRNALETALQAYRTAAEYGVAGVTTAATYEMAELYRTLGADLMKSERPKGMSPDELEQYDLLLEEQAFPFEEQAIDTHEINAGRAHEGLYDDSVRRSFAALAELEPGRYAKSEILQDIEPSLVVPLASLPEPPAAASDGAPAGAPVAPAPRPPPAPPARAVADFELALQRMRAGNVAEAELELKQVALAWPQFPGPQVNLGILLRKGGRLDEAEAALRAAVEIAPAHAAAWTELGAVQRMAGKFTAALGSYERALAANPDYAPAYRNLAVLSDLYLGDGARALEGFERYRALVGGEDRQLNGWIAELRQRTGQPATTPEGEAAPPSQAAPAAGQDGPEGEA